MDFSTLCIHGQGKSGLDNTGAVSVPIYQSATFGHPGVGNSTGYDYSRLQNPTREQLERTMAELEGGVDTMAFSSGMAAVTALFEMFRPGDHIIATDDLYGGSIRLFNHISKKNGLSFDFVDTSSAEAVAALIRPETKAVYLETPTNPMMIVTDIAETAALCREHKLLLIVDNTFLSPYFMRPLLLGADVVLHSGTKFISGHNDTLCGFLSVRSQALAEHLRFIYKTTGAALSPFDSWLMIRSLKTLPLRMERQQENAFRIAEWLQMQDNVIDVNYIGLPEHPGYEISKRQASGFGAMISFTVDSSETARHILENLRLITFAESLGGVESLMTYPYLQTHADVPEREREARGINDRLLRLSVGAESAEDLIADLSGALSLE